MSESRITTGDISNIMKANEVERKGLAEIYRTTKKVKKGEGEIYLCTFEFWLDDGRKYWEDKPKEFPGDFQMGYATTVRDVNDALIDLKLYIANARLLYPAVSIKFSSVSEKGRMEGLQVGWGDLYSEKSVDLGMSMPRRFVGMPISPVAGNN